MKNIIIIAITFITLGCGSEDLLEFGFSGKWHDVHNYPSTVIDSSGNQTFVQYPNIEIEAFEDSTYTISGEVVTGLHGNGKWTYNKSTIEFYDIEIDLQDSLTFDYFRKHTWDVIEVTEDSLKVLHNYTGEPFMGSEDSIRYSFYRTFERIK